MNVLYSIECHTCDDGDLGASNDYAEARDRMNSHADRNAGHRVHIYEDGAIAA